MMEIKQDHIYIAWSNNFYRSLNAQLSSVFELRNVSPIFFLFSGTFREVRVD